MKRFHQFTPLACLALTLVFVSCKGRAQNTESTNANAEDEEYTGVKTSIHQEEGVTSIDLGKYTISKVRTAVNNKTPYIVASSYEGTLMGVNYLGNIGWTNELSGFMNRDIYCADITGNGSQEILAANADGSLYCLDGQGKNLWKFKPSDAPMNAVTVLHHDGKPYVVCGGYDKNIYYLDAKGELVKTIASSTYSKDKPWGKPTGKRIPPKFTHIANFIRTVHGPDGKEALAVHGNIYSNSSGGSLYLFKPMADKPFHTIKKLEMSAGDLQIVDTNNDGIDELLGGSTSMIQDAGVVWLDLKNYKQRVFDISKLRRRIDGFGYRVAQTVSFGPTDKQKLFTSFGSRIFISNTNLDPKITEIITVGYSFNDLCKDPTNGKVILASTQTGGSGIHIIDPSVKGWKKSLANFKPVGKLKSLLQNTATTREQLKTFKRPAHERAPKKIYMMTESLTGNVKELALGLEARHGTPVFLKGGNFPQVEKFDRSNIANEKYRKRQDRRKKYTLTQEEALEKIRSLYKPPYTGAAFWAGHGNDPYMFSTDTMKRAVDGAKGKKSVFIYPELEQYDTNFKYVLDHHIYPIAEHAKGKNTNIYVRTKHAFWQSIIYQPLWSRLLSGEFADVFVPSMEETTDKTMEQSVAGRVGIWASGATNQWGSRGARDNPSFDRLRQHSHQMIPNHFLRAQIYNLSCGSTYQNNFAVNQDYFSILYELIAKGALFVPERNEIVSFNPVHLSMATPDKLYMDDGNNAKWTTFFDQKSEDENPMVFGRLNGSWPGSPVTEWDFSRYAAGVKDRRLNFLPPYPHGLVLITPPQNGELADKDAARGAMADNLHPIYKTILKEYITDGRNYISADGKQKFAANEHYKQIESDIQDAAIKLPLTVTGEVAWVVAQTSPAHLRLTLIDGGYINPSDKTATITFHTVKPVAIKDILSGEKLDTSDPSVVKVDIPCGLFRFINIEIAKPLK